MIVLLLNTNFPTISLYSTTNQHTMMIRAVTWKEEKGNDRRPSERRQTNIVVTESMLTQNSKGSE